MTDKPIIFSAPMIRALLDGRKTQTRRILKPQPPYGLMPECMAIAGEAQSIGAGWSRGDRLWVREAHYLTDDGECEYAVFAADQDGVDEHLDGMQSIMASHPSIDRSKHLRLRPSIHMPRWASRLTLIVTDVRVQRLQEISGVDAVAEGVSSRLPTNGIAQAEFMDVWDRLYGSGARYLNPWVCALTFTVHKQNIDQMEAAE